MKQEELRRIYCMDKYVFAEILERDDEDPWLTQQWNRKQDDLAIFLMELDEGTFAKFNSFMNEER